MPAAERPETRRSSLAESTADHPATPYGATAAEPPDRSEIGSTVMSSAAGKPAATDADPDQIAIRLCAEADASQLADLYNHYVTSSTVTFDLEPRSLAEQVDWIRSHSGSHPAVVAHVGETVIGYSSLTPYRPRLAYTTSVEESIYVHKDWHGRGVGRLLMARILELADLYGYHTVIARVVGGHSASIALHESLGFAQIGTERQIGRKFGRWLDVVVLQYMVP
ncbi:MAG: N-acetyltransferase [Acidimicrobiia bacterium]|nr:N-acetyltransferase [Acidimicrobiia bacterium]MBP8181325.1 N-acetyltransferase [Acidimicrobiia bacterium]